MPTRGLVYGVLAGVLLGWGGIDVAQADTLVIDAVKQGAGVDCPTRGQSMAQVEARYGQPKQVLPATGQPPITRWVYDRFTVYFEGSTVVHSVVRR